MTDFSTDEQVDVLFKNYIGVPTTRKDREWYQESYLTADPSNSLTSGHGLNHNNITLNENIWSQTIDASFVPTDVSVNLTDYVAGTYDVSAVFRNADGDAAAKVLRIEKLKLERVESGNDQAWYCLGDNSVNVLEDIIPFNFRETALSIPYAYKLYNGESTEMAYGETGGNWMIDHRTGVVYIPDVENVTLDGSGLYLTFYKYVGGKGVGIEYDRNNNLTVQPSGGFISFGSKFAVGKTIPSTELDVSGNVNISGNVDVSGNIDVSGTIITNGNVGIGKTNPSTELDVSGSITASGNVDVGGSITATGNVGIGTTGPVCKLDVNYPEAWLQHNNSAVRSELAPSHYIASFRPESDGADAYISVRASGEGNKAGIYFGTPGNSYTPNKCAIIAEGGQGYSKSKLHFCFAHNNDNYYGQAAISSSEGASRMTITHGGNVGIGTTSPSQRLHVNGHIVVGAHDSQPTDTTLLVDPNGKQNAIMFYNRYYTWGGGSTIHNQPGNRTWHNFISSKFHSTTPYSGSGGYHAFLLWTYTGHLGTSDIAMRLGSGNGNSTIWVNGSTSVSSDRRIKTNITDVPDDLALEMVRKIPCRYYEYKRDIYNEYEYGREKPNRTIGFIAQEVKDICPEAVSLTDYKVPLDNRIYRDLDIQIDNSNNFIIIKDFTNNDLSGNDELECIINPINNNNITEDNVEEYIDSNDSKVINIKYISDCKFEILDDISNVEIQEIILKNKKIDDFHTLDKQKLFALNFSATQEIDRQQQADKVKIATLETRNEELKNEVATLKSELAAIKAHLGL